MQYIFTYGKFREVHDCDGRDAAKELAADFSDPCGLHNGRMRCYALLDDGKVSGIVRSELVGIFHNGEQIA